MVSKTSINTKFIILRIKLVMTTAKCICNDDEDDYNFCWILFIIFILFNFNMAFENIIEKEKRNTGDLFISICYRFDWHRSFPQWFLPF